MELGGDGVNALRPEGHLNIKTLSYYFCKLLVY